MENDIEKSLVVIVKENDIELVTEGQLIIDAFSGFYKQAKSFEDLSKTLIVSDISQVEEMAQAKEARKVLKQCRLNAEQARKDFKSGYLNKGKAVDMIAKLVSTTIEPLESYFEAQEKFAENIEKAKIREMIVSRETALKQYVEDISIYNVVVMSDEAFNTLLDDLKSSYEKKQAELAKIETDRIEKERLEREEEKNKLEVARLQKEAEIRDAEILKERAEREAKEKKEREDAHMERERILFEQKKKDEEAEKKLEIERKAKEELEKKERERIAKEAKELADKEKAEREAKLAPEKDKLNNYAEMIKSIVAPQDLSKAGQLIIVEAEKSLLSISQRIKDQVKNL